MGIPFYPQCLLRANTLFVLAEESNDTDTPFFACVYCDMDDVKKWLCVKAVMRRSTLFPHTLIWDADANTLFLHGRQLTDLSLAFSPLVGEMVFGTHDSDNNPRSIQGGLSPSVEELHNQEKIQHAFQRGREELLLSLQQFAIVVFRKNRVDALRKSHA